MGECEICGEGEAVFLISIEGAKMRACGDCARRGKIISRVTSFMPAKKGAQGAQSRPVASRIEPEIVSDYAERIREARRKMTIGVDVVADMVFEKQSYLERVEAGKTLPSEALAKKLEKALGIKLFDDGGYAPSGEVSRKKAGGTTLGDLVVVKKKKGES